MYNGFGSVLMNEALYRVLGKMLERTVSVIDHRFHASFVIY